MWELDCKEGRALKNWCFELWCWRRLLRVPWTTRRSNQSILKEISPFIFLKKTYFIQNFHLTDESASIVIITQRTQCALGLTLDVHSMLLLSRFSRVRLRAIPEMAAHQAPPSLGFSRQEHWSGLPFPSPMQESEKWKWSCSIVSDSSDPMDCSLPGSSVHGIFQAKVLEWGAIAFSDMLILISTNSNLKMQRRLCCRVTHLPPSQSIGFSSWKKNAREQGAGWTLLLKACSKVM